MSEMEVAIRKGNLESVKRLVAEGADVKENIYHSYTPLLFAAAKGSIPIMHWLLT
jgi:ankyrin repeat protein